MINDKKRTNKQYVLVRAGRHGAKCVERGDCTRTHKEAASLSAPTLGRGPLLCVS